MERRPPGLKSSDIWDSCCPSIPTLSFGRDEEERRVRKELSLMPRIPVSTYRLQFNGQFTFSDAKRIISYLNDLGISDIYASPYFQAREGSLHGYDIVDHNALNPEIGTHQEYDEMTAELGKYAMGQILDIVPNHMCIASAQNSWWMDVLENGPSSVYAHYFDIDWDPVKKELRNKVLLPVLGDQYGKVLENRELQLAFEDGSFFIRYYEHTFPVIPKTYIQILKHRLEDLEEALPSGDPYFVELLSIITALTHLPSYTERAAEKVEERYREKEIVKKRLWTLWNESPAVRTFIDENVRIFNGTEGDPSSFNLLDELLGMQVYRLAYWRVATEEINYRRFFDVNHLGALRVEFPDVFRETHRLVMELIRKGQVTGLRVDHPDGLYDPSGYFRELQKNCFLQARLGYKEALGREIKAVREGPGAEEEILKLYKETTASDPSYKPFYVVGEKILIKGERMPEEWPIFSTTGYVFLNSVNGIFVDSGNARAFDEIYTRFIREKMNLQEIVYEKKKLIMQVSMSSEVNTLGHYLNRISEKNRHTRDFTLNSLTHAIIEVIAYFPVYRTYTNSDNVTDRDRQYTEQSLAKAKRKNPAISESIFDFLRDVLFLRYPVDCSEDDRKEWLDFVMKFQQITGPVMAKAVEDTAFYVYNRLVSLNEVGGAPERFGTPLDTFHGQNIERSKFWPHALIASSTHDTKRSEDVRARINVLSEIPEKWKRHVLLWRRLNKKKKTLVDNRAVPDRNEEYLLYQTLIGAWPAGAMDESAYGAFRERIREYMLKAAREAKVNTSWINPSVLYEEALGIFTGKILENRRDNPFLKDFIDFQKKVSGYGMYNSLSQALLRITSPGVPDFYQGTELWNFALVDPDNRLPVDYDARITMLAEINRLEQDVGRLELSRRLWADRDSGMIKMYVISRALQYRRNSRALFDQGEYLPLEVQGSGTENVCAFARRLGNENAIVAVPRFLTRIMPDPAGPSSVEEIWSDSYVVIPYAEEGAAYRSIFTGETNIVQRRNEASVVPVSGIFGHLPLALLERVVA
jgi:(1->4)-alpha-D-glucan 1-alpha-D-glucosylmutase